MTFRQSRSTGSIQAVGYRARKKHSKTHVTVTFENFVSPYGGSNTNIHIKANTKKHKTQHKHTMKKVKKTEEKREKRPTTLT